MSNINLKQLEVFAAVVEYGSFTEAANQLYMAQSTVSSHIHALEEILQTSLFHRGTKKNGTLTDDGKRVYQLARDVLEKCRALETGLVEEKRSELRIGASTAPSCQLVPSFVAAFSRRRSDCCVSLRHGDSSAVQEMLLEREIQVGFVGSADNRQELSYECIAKDRLVLIAPNQERYAAMQAQGRLGRELLTEPLLSREYGSGTQEMVDNYLTGAQLPDGGHRLGGGAAGGLRAGGLAQAEDERPALGPRAQGQGPARPVKLQFDPPLGVFVLPRFDHQYLLLVYYVSVFQVIPT